MKISELLKFQPKQIEALEAVKKYKYTLYGGAAGGGKSYFLRWVAVYLLMYFAAVYKAKGVRIGLFCEDYPALEDRQLSKIRYEFPSWLGDMNQQRHEYVLKPKWGGGVIAFRNLDDPSKYLSSEFACILIDELTRNPRDIFDFLTGMRMRWPNLPAKEWKFVGATNPGGIGHLWVKKLWIDRDFSDEPFDPNDFVFVQAFYSDNKYIDAGYEKQLASLPEKQRRAYLEGDWDIFEGQFFTEWRRDIHVIEPFEIPESWPRYVGIDYGTANPFCALWMAVDYDGNVYVYRELYDRGLTAKEQAKLIREASRNENIYAYVCDPSMKIKNQGRGSILTSIADDYRSEGVPVIFGNNDRIHGANVVRRYLRQDENGKAKLRVFSTCQNLIRTLPALVHDEKKPEDVDTRGEDHAYDALRYGLLFITEPQKPKEPDPFEGRVQWGGLPMEKPEKDKRVFW